MDWQPIETAPRDGMWILVVGGMTCDDDIPHQHAIVQWTQYLNGHETEGHWQFAWYDGGYCGLYKNPTHWMPLPAPPTKDAPDVTNPPALDVC